MVEDIAALESLLDEHGPLTARKIVELRPAWDDRHVRELAGRSRAILSFPGSPGYRLIRACTAEDLGHAADALISQAKVQIRRGIEYRRLAALAAQMSTLTQPAKCNA